MTRKWLESLDEETRARAERLIEQLSALGAPHPEAWARREFREHLPQLSRFLLLRHLWSEAIDAWSDSLLWVENLIQDAEKSPNGQFADAGRALKRLLDLGADPKDIGTLARFVAYESVFSVIHAIDEGYDVEQEGEWPGWALVERDPLGHITKRELEKLHADLLGLDLSRPDDASD